MFLVSKIIDSAEELLVTKCKELFYKKIELSSNNNYAAEAIIRYVNYLNHYGADIPQGKKDRIGIFFDQCENRVFRLAMNRIRFSHSANNTDSNNKNYDVSYYTWQIEITGVNAPKLHNIFMLIYRHTISQIDNTSSKTNVIVSYPSIKHPNRISDYSHFMNKGEIPSYNDIVGPHKTALFNTISDFMSSKNIYTKYKMPFKLNILISGPPGTGKTSAVKCVAKEYDLNLEVINSKTSIADFVTRRAEYSNRNHVIIRLFEEIDVIQENSSDDLDLILQYLDGSLTKSGVINIMTTNYPNKLDPRLLRDGRVDYHLEMDRLTYDEAFEPFRKKYDLTSDEMSKCLAECKLYENEKYSPAEIENKIMTFIRLNRCHNRKVEKR